MYERPRANVNFCARFNFYVYVLALYTSEKLRFTFTPNGKLEFVPCT